MKGIFDGTLIASDLDGTLITSSYRIPEANLRELEFYKSNGGRFAVSTGRALQSCECFLKQFKPNAPCILLNGAQIYDYNAGKTVWQYFMPYNAVQTAIHIANKFPEIGVEVFGEKGVFVVRLSRQMQQHLLNDNMPYTMCKNGFDDASGEFYKVLFVGESELVERILSYTNTFDHTGVTFVKSSPCYLELIPSAVSKGAALKILVQYLNIDINNTYGMGDFFNDESLIRAAGTGVCVSSAPNEIKAISDITLGNCEQGAAALLVSHIVRSNQSNRRFFKMDFQKKKELMLNACKVRQFVIEGTYNAKSGHPGGSLSAADIITYLYFARLNIRPEEPKWNERDRFVLSKGHAAPVLYGALALRGFFDTELIKTLRHPGSILQGHPDMKSVPGVDMSTGSLGQGVSCAVGMAIDAKTKGRANKVFTVLGDGEIEEGQVWEAAMLAGHKKLDNLVAVVDNNNLQIDGEIGTVVSPYPITDKFAAFGWYVIEINGNDFDEIEAAFNEADTVKGKPVVIVAKTIKGKGISFMENKVDWHGVAPNAEQYEAAMQELKEQYAALEVM